MLYCISNKEIPEPMVRVADMKSTLVQLCDDVQSSLSEIGNNFTFAFGNSFGAIIKTAVVLIIITVSILTFLKINRKINCTKHAD